jgi:uncharacterized protein YdeI (YjbR/CyaY-like superfamily)
MQQTGAINIYYPKSQADWRSWLEENHATEQSVWLVFYKKASGKPTLTWSDAVDEALCFGWIDSKKVSIDHETSHQFFCKRKPKSTWSKINKDKIENLLALGKMTSAGMKSVEIAKENGSWTYLDGVESLQIPQELEIAFTIHEGLKVKFQSLSKSKRKLMLYSLLSAKTAITKQKRIEEIVRMLVL